MSRTLVDQESIRSWAEDRGAVPASVKGTGGGDDPGIIRLDFEGYSGEESLEPISWDDWFRKFETSRLALVVDDRGSAPNFNKLVSRDGASAAGNGEDTNEEMSDEENEDEDEDDEFDDDDLDEEEEDEDEEKA
jgi:hypothetical protein